ncbi:MAG: threonylcarbamoyl-AMP synthase [Flavobacteriales bacterium]|nr:threonylcarbamoyl-AMP synthase [Flavobacteriales bacterium]
MKATIGKDIARAALLLSDGELVAIPTETVYGLAANAFDPDAVLRIFQVKQRPAFDPLIVHVHGRSQVEQVVSEVPVEAQALMDRFWPGPLTLVLPKSPRVPDIVTSGLDTVGVRMPAHPMALELLRSLDFPLAAPSANPFGYVSPTTAQHVTAQLGKDIPYVLDGGPCAVGVESTIIGWEEGLPVLFRPGGLPLERIEAVIGTVRPQVEHVLPVAPGMIESHYAPSKPLVVGDMPALLGERAGMRIGVIAFRDRFEATRCETLSPDGDVDEAARALFAAMRALDASDIEVILAEVFPEEGLGRAINDRLGRAAVKRRMT